MKASDESRPHGRVCTVSVVGVKSPLCTGRPLPPPPTGAAGDLLASRLLPVARDRRGDKGGGARSPGTCVWLRGAAPHSLGRTPLAWTSMEKFRDQFPNLTVKIFWREVPQPSADVESWCKQLASQETSHS